MKIYRNIRFIIILCLVAGALFFLRSSLLSLSKGYINHFFTNLKKPEIVEDGGQKDAKLDDENKQDKNRDGDSLVILSENFVKYSFDKDEKNIKSMLANNTFYIKSLDGSSFLRCINGEQHVEGYMATDKNLSEYKQKWFYTEDDTAISGMEIVVENHDKPLIWYLYFKKEKGLWKLFMLENE